MKRPGSCSCYWKVLTTVCSLTNIRPIILLGLPEYIGTRLWPLVIIIPIVRLKKGKYYYISHNLIWTTQIHTNFEDFILVQLSIYVKRECLRYRSHCIFCNLLGQLQSSGNDSGFIMSQLSTFSGLTTKWKKMEFNDSSYLCISSIWSTVIVIERH